jgi:hypothetical protein
VDPRTSLDAVVKQVVPSPTLLRIESRSFIPEPMKSFGLFLLVGFCEYGNEPSGSINDWKFLD